MDLNLDGGNLATAGGAGLVGALAPKLLAWGHKLFSRRLKEEREQGALHARVTNLEGWMSSIDKKLDDVLLLLAGGKKP